MDFNKFEFSHEISIVIKLSQWLLLISLLTLAQLFFIQTSFAESIKIDDERLPETPRSKNIKLQDTYEDNRDKKIMNLIHELQNSPPEVSTKKSALTSEENTIYFYNNIKKKRGELKTLLRELLNENTPKNKKFNDYEEILKAHPSTATLLTKSTQEGLQERMEELREEAATHQQLQRSLAEEMYSKLEKLYKSSNWTNPDKKQSFAEFSIFENYQKRIVTEQNLASDALQKLKVLEDRKNETGSLGYSFKSPSETSSFVTIDKNRCREISFDNRSKMGPDSDQADTGTCWAHSAAAMLEEQLCLAHPEHCGKNIARTQIIGNTTGIDFTPGGTMDGGNPSTVLRYFTDKRKENFEVCLDPYNANPFDLSEKDVNTQSRSFLRKFFRKKDKNQGPGFDYINFLRLEYSRITSNRHSCSGQMNSDQLDHLSKHWNQLLAFLDEATEKTEAKASQFIGKGRQSSLNPLTFWRKKSAPKQNDILKLTEEDFDLSLDLTNHLSREKFEQLARESKKEIDFIERVLLAPCLNPSHYANLKRDKDQTLFTLLLLQRDLTNVPKLYHVFQEAVHFKHSVQINLCERELSSKLSGFGISFIHPTECPPGHSVVANGVKWNSKNNQCEIHIKNSWGSVENFKSSWYPIEPILSTTMEANYFGSK